MNENDDKTLRIPRYPEVWPGWETVDKLGSGSFGAVYKIQRRSGSFTEYAAVKCISIPKDPDEVDKLRKSGYDIDSITEMFLEQSRQFEQEYRLMAVLKGNTNIVDCDDLRSVRRSDTLGFALSIKMELLTPLDDMEFSRFTEPEIIRLGRDLCKALELCEQHKIIHRDIKPANIFVSDNGDYKLGDFGVSRIMEHTNTEGTVTGTPRFMAPEVYGNRSYNHTVDIYSLGLVLYWLLNEQRTPFQPLPPAKLSYSGNQEALNRRMKGEPIPEPKNGSAALRAVVLKAVRYESSERYQTAEEMRRAIGDVERKAREEEERKRKEEAERRAREEAERKAKEEAERRAREEAERKAREEAERKAKEEAKRKAREEAKQKAKEEAERKAAEKAQRRVERKAEPKPPHLKKLLLLLLALLVIPGAIFFPRGKEKELIQVDSEEGEEKSLKQVDERDANTNAIKSSFYLPDGTLDHIIEYDDIGIMSKEIVFKADGGKTVTEYVAEKMTKKIVYNAAGEVNWTYEFDSAGNKVKDTEFLADGNVKSWREYENDISGNVSKEIKYNSDGVIDYIKDFDMDGNLIKDTLFSAGRIWYVTEYLTSGIKDKTALYRADGSIEQYITYNRLSGQRSMFVKLNSAGSGIEEVTYYKSNGTSLYCKYDDNGKKLEEILYDNIQGSMIYHDTYSYDYLYDANHNLQKVTSYKNGEVIGWSYPPSK